MTDAMQMAIPISLFFNSKNRSIHENYFPHCSLKAIKPEGGAQTRCTTANTCYAIATGFATFASAKPPANVMYPQPEPRGKKCS